MTEFSKGDVVEINGYFTVVRILESGRVLLQATQERQVAFPADYLGIVGKAKPANPFLKICEGLLRPTVEVLVRDSKGVRYDGWFRRCLDKVDKESEFPFHTNNYGGTWWKMCVPLKGNEHLEGTIEPYKGGEG
jgi:hypothetical protein